MMQRIDDYYEDETDQGTIETQRHREREEEEEKREGIGYREMIDDR